MGVTATSHNMMALNTSEMKSCQAVGVWLWTRPNTVLCPAFGSHCSPYMVTLQGETEEYQANSGLYDKDHGPQTAPAADSGTDASAGAK